jgi:plasmid maintenance system antidote protein VapI
VSTIADVAREAGVSVSIVWRVVNGGRRVSPATALKAAIGGMLRLRDFRARPR